MASAKFAEPAERSEREGARDRLTVEPQDVDLAAGSGSDRPVMTDACDPLTELGPPAEREGAK